MNLETASPKATIFGNRQVVGDAPLFVRPPLHQITVNVFAVTEYSSCIIWGSEVCVGVAVDHNV